MGPGRRRIQRHRSPRPLQLHIPPARFVAWFSDDCGKQERNRGHEVTNGVLIVAWFVASRRPGWFGRRRRSAAGAWRAWAARHRLLGHAVNRFGQHERANDHDRRKGCRYDCRRLCASNKAVSKNPIESDLHGYAVRAASSLSSLSAPVHWRSLPSTGRAAADGLVSLCMSLHPASAGPARGRGRKVTSALGLKVHGASGQGPGSLAQLPS